MSPLTLVWRRSRWMLLASVATSVVSGLSNTALVAVISRVLNGTSDWTPLVVASFAGLCLLSPVSRFASQMITMHLAQSIRVDLVMRLGRKVVDAPLRQIEEIGPHTLLVGLTDDVDAVVQALTLLPNLFLNAAMLIGCGVYLGWSSPIGLAAVIAFVSCGVMLYIVLSARAATVLQRVGEERAVLFGHFRGLTDGIKELKLHARRRAAFLDRFVERSVRAVQKGHTQAHAIFTLIGSLTMFLYFTVIGVLLFVMPAIVTVPQSVMVSYTVTLLFMLLPIDAVFGLIAQLDRGRLAFTRLERLERSLRTEEPSAADAERGRLWTAGERHRTPTVALSGVTHQYRGEDDGRVFTLGPIDLSFVRPEIVFIVGGNGSGKTTLAKILTGLYSPMAGTLRLDGRVVGEGEREEYRQLFAAVFYDFHLFECLLGIDEANRDRRATEFLRELHLDRTVAIVDGRFSTLKLSQGQRKRLALLSACMEDRPVFVADEWASDQDPVFKDVFYRHLLPRLRDQGRLVLIITHDDRYTDIADRVVRLEQGQIVFDGAPMVAV